MVIKKSLVVAALCCILGIAFQQRTEAAEQELPAAALVVNPLGFFQFGPILDLELRVQPNVVAFLHYRHTAFGALAHALMVSEKEELSASSGAFGGGLRYLFPLARGPHRPYIGFLIEYGWTGYRGSIGYSDEYEGTSKYVDFIANGGFRWNFQPLMVNVGAYLGSGSVLENEYKYKDTGEVVQGKKDSMVIAMLELSFGFAF